MKPVVEWYMGWAESGTKITFSLLQMILVSSAIACSDVWTQNTLKFQMLR